MKALENLLHLFPIWTFPVAPRLNIRGVEPMRKPSGATNYPFPFDHTKNDDNKNCDSNSNQNDGNYNICI